jgi:glutamate--cysteine ligase catalytic subunit
MIANVINYYDVDFVVPISLVDENMKTAHIRDALCTSKFWWKSSAIKRDENGRPFKSKLEENGFVKNRTDASR